MTLQGAPKPAFWNGLLPVVAPAPDCAKPEVLPCPGAKDECMSGSDVSAVDLHAGGWRLEAGVC